MKISKQLALDIAKGRIGDSVCLIADLHDITKAELAALLREIADKLEKK